MVKSATDPRLEGRPRIGKNVDFDFMVNRQGRKWRAFDPSIEKFLSKRGWRHCTLDEISEEPIYDDTVLIFRYRGGFGDLITALPGIENIAMQWKEVHIAVPKEFLFLYAHIENAKLFDYHELFGISIGPERKHTTRYLEVRERYRLSLDMFCPAGVHENYTKQQPTFNRIECFSWLLDEPSRAPVIPEANFGGKESVVDLEVPSMKFTLREWTQKKLRGEYKALVGVQIQSENVSKDWAIGNYRKLCNVLLRNDILPVVFHPNMIIGEFPHFVKQPIKTVTAALSWMDLVIGPDSGLLHTAAALGKPTIWLFGPTAGSLTIKYYKDAKVVECYTGLKCRFPCYYSREMNGFYCIDRYGDCMNKITVGMVYKKIQESLIAGS